MQNLADIFKLAETEAEPMGLLVVDTRLCQQGRRRVLEVSICRKGGRISLEDCEELSRRLDRALSEQLPPLIDGSYLLEVQSPGIDRQLKSEREFKIFAGEVVAVRTKEPVEALGDNFTGKLQSMADGVLTIINPQPQKTTASSKRHKKANANAADKPAAPPASVELEWARVTQVRLHPSEPPLESTAHE
jgi:ribosome maturation factor RimP